jgi:CyaY protein
LKGGFGRVWFLIVNEKIVNRHSSVRHSDIHQFVIYDVSMDELEFRRKADAAISALTKSLYAAEADAGFEVEERDGAVHIEFEEPPGRFVISPNAPVRQIWISALSTSFKLDWSDSANDFVLTKSNEPLKALMARLINQQLGSENVKLV